MVARDDLPVCGVCSAKAAASRPAVFMPGPDDVVAADESVPSLVDEVDGDASFEVEEPEVPDPEPVERRPADVRPAPALVPVKRDSRLWIEGWRPWRGRSW